MICGRPISLRCIRTHVSTKVIITFSPSLTYWASLRWPYRSRVKVEARQLMQSPRYFERTVDIRKTYKPIWGEFYNADMQRFVNKHGINHYSTYSIMKESIVERFNRTLKNVEGVYAQRKLQVDWPVIASRVELQCSKASTIGMRPVDITPATAERLLTTVYSAIKIAGPAKFKVGDSSE